jgi:hypothetical protein
MSTLHHAAPELYLGSDHAAALALGPRRFRSVANAIRFAMERTAPVSRHGAILRTATDTMHIAQIQRLHRKLAAAA